MQVYLVVSPGLGDAAAVIEAIRHHARVATPSFRSVWAGDPHLRPTAPAAAPWADLGWGAPRGLPWGVLQVALPPDAFALLRGLVSIAAEGPRSPSEPRLLLQVGQAAVTGDVTAVGPPARGVAAVPRALYHGPGGGAPDHADLAVRGRWSTAALWLGAAAWPLASSLSDALLAATAPGTADGIVAAALDTLALLERSGAEVVPTPGYVVGWTDVRGRSIAPLIDVADLVSEGREPLYAGFGDRPPRLSLADTPDVLDALRSTADQWAGVPAELALPGGVVVDPVVRAVTADAVARHLGGDPGALPPDPFGPAGAGFRAWLESPWPAWGADIGRYWTEVWRQRPDVAAAFPDPGGVDAERFAAWAVDSWRFEPRSRLIEARSTRLRPVWPGAGRAPGGVNVVGYVTVDNSLGNVARRFLAALAAAGVAHVALDYHRTGSPALPDPPPLGDGPRYATNLIVLNPDQMGGLAADHPALLDRRRNIAFWHWDVEHVPPEVVGAADRLDEVWVLTEFTRQALTAALPVPVRVVLPAVPEAQPSAATRAELGVPDSRFVFLVVLDHLSQTARKNPLGAVEAFRRAFPHPTAGGPVLIVKTTNAAHRWAAHERLRVAAAGRPDIVVVDRRLSRGDQIALVHHADCLVSLHRSEGLGLHLCEAMWAGVPTIATRYSGNLAFQDDTNALLVDAGRVPVGVDGEGLFPPEAEWADPDLEQAAAHMRRLVAEPRLHAALAAAGRAAMEAQPTLADTGARVADLVGLRSGRIAGS